MTTTVSFVKQIRLFLYLIPLSWLLFSCSEEGRQRRESKGLLIQAAALVEAEPEQALGMLQTIDVRLLDESDYHYFVLLEVRVSEMTMENISYYESAVLKAKEYFTRHNNIEKTVLACFGAARVFEAQRNQTKALYYYLQAEEWAKKVDYKIPFFLYSAIPYNIAIANYQNAQYSEAISYLTNAIVHIEAETGKAEHKLFALEMKGVCYKNLKLLDSASLYYQQALTIAKQNNDTSSKNRIVYNLLNLESKDDTGTVERANKLLESLSEKDSVIIGAAHIMLADAYCNLNELPSASRNADKAADLLQDANENIRLFLYGKLAKLEEKKKDTQKAKYYQEQHKKMLTAIEVNRLKQQTQLTEELLAELQVELAQRKGELEAAKLSISGYLRTLFRYEKSTKQTLILFGFATLLLLTAVTYFSKRRKKNLIRKLAVQDIAMIISRQDFIDRIKELSRQQGSKDILDIADDLTYITDSSSILDSCYGGLYERLKKLYPTLSKSELMICWLKAAGVASDLEILSLTKLTEAEYVQATKSMQQKIRQAGKKYSFRSITKTLFKGEKLNR